MTSGTDRDTTQATGTDRNGLLVESCLLALIILVVSIANVQWILKDAAPMPHPVDPYVYASNTLAFLDGSEPGGIQESLSRLSYQGRPPLYQMLSMPFVALLGRSTDAMLGVNVFLNGLLLVGVFALGRSVANGRAGLLAAAVLAASPPLIHLSRVYRPHAVIPAFAVLSVWLLLRLVRDRSVKNAWLFCGSLAVGILLHPTFGNVLLIPTLSFGAYAVFFRGSPRRPARAVGLLSWLVARLTQRFVIRGLAPAGTLAVLAAASWYATEGRVLFDKLQELRTVERTFRIGFSDVEPDFWWYALTAPGAVTNVIALLCAAGVLACLAKRRLGTLLIASTALAGYTIESIGSTRAWWYFLSVLPFWSLALGVWIAELRPRWLAGLLGAAALFASSISFFVSTWGAPNGMRPIAAALGAQLDSSMCDRRRASAFCPTPPEADVWPIRELLKPILKDAPDCRSGETPCQVFLVVKSFVDPRPAEWPTMMTAYFDYHAARHWPGANMEFEAFKRGLPCAAGTGLDSDYIVFFRSIEPLGSDCIHNWTLFLDSPTPAFSKFYDTLATVALPGGRTADVIKRSRLLAPPQKRAAIRAVLNLPAAR